MTNFRVDVRHIRELHTNLVAAQEEGSGWRDSIDEAKAAVEDLLRDADEQHPMILSYSSVSLSPNVPTAAHAQLDIDFHDEKDPDVVVGTLTMSPERARTLIGTLQEYIAELDPSN